MPPKGEGNAGGTVTESTEDDTKTMSLDSSDSDSSQDDRVYILRLYVAGQTRKSLCSLCQPQEDL